MKNIVLILTMFFVIGFGYSTGTTEKMTLVTSPIPEPATMLILGIGIIGLSAIVRKKFIKSG